MRSVVRNEQSYYEDLMTYSRENLMLYPYHLSDVIVKGLRITPFQFYISTIIHVMESDKSYDSIPNFTAVDCKYKLFYVCNTVMPVTQLFFLMSYMNNITKNVEKY